MAAPARRQFVGAGTTKLSIQLWFDVTAPTAAGGAEGQGRARADASRSPTSSRPKPAEDDKTKFVPPAVRFLWGSFQFDGIMESLEESLEFFSPEGRPLRASVSLNLSQQKIEFLHNRRQSPAGCSRAGHANLWPRRPPAPPCRTWLRGWGKAQDWQTIAAANGIENPRLLRPGQLIDMNVPSGKP